MIKTARFTEEHNAPMTNLVERFTLERGSDTLVIPKVAQMTMGDLVDGQDMVSEQDIGMTTVSVSPNEVGGKVIVTDKLLRENTSNVFSMVGRQLGDAMARKKDGDLLNLFSALNGGTDLGATTRVFTAENATRLIQAAKSDKYGSNLRIVHHPGAMFRLASDLNTIGSLTGGFPGRSLPPGFVQAKLENFYTGIRLGGVPFFEDGNISEDASGDGVGAIFDLGAIGLLTSVGMRKERQRDASLRGWEVILTADYAAFEIDDSRGAPATFAVTNTTTT
jgi:hypothetical protein